MEISLEQQMDFAKRMMMIDNDIVIPKRKKTVVVKVKKHRKTISDIQREVAETAGLTLLLESYDDSKKRIEERAKIFDTNVTASVSELTGIERDDAAEEERRFVQFLIAERKARNEWIEAQNFPLVEYTEEDYEDELREKEAKTIFFNHTHQQQ